MAYTSIDDPTAYFQTKTYTGSANAQSITFDGNSNLQPDWIWIKERGATGGHVVTDTVRGISASSAPFLQPSANGVQIDGNGTEANRTLTSSNTNGFTLGQDAYYTNFNNNSDTYVSWNWKAGGSASSNSNGSITSSVSANTTAGFSIVSFTGNGSAGATVGHGLSAIPKFILVKVHTSSTAYDWRVFHASLGATKNLILNDTSTVATATNKWNDTEPTSSVFSLGNTAGTNESGSGIIAYCFAEKKGYSKFGSYEGTNSAANGAFVFTGMKPKFIMLKNVDAAKDWNIYDSARDIDNPLEKKLEPNTTDAESTDLALDFLANGFKFRQNGSNFNDANTYIYMAFAENPFVTSTGIPTTAR